MVLCLVPTGVSAEGETTEKIDITGSGTKEDPYLIYTAEGLKVFRDKANGGQRPSNKKCRNGLIMPQTAVYRSLRNVPTLCKIGFPAYSILFHHLILTVLPKAAITKLKFLKEMHTVTKISEDSKTASYIFFHIQQSKEQAAA